METWKKADGFAAVREKVNGNFGSVTDALAGLSTALAGKAEGTALTALQTAVGAKAEQSALTAARTALEGQISAVQALAEGKAELVLGSYTGDGEGSRTITLGFQPQAVFLITQNGLTGSSYGSYMIYGGLALWGLPLVHTNNIEQAMTLTATGFRLTNDTYREVNISGWKYYYVAMK